MTIQDWLGEDNKLGIDIWRNKYTFENESFDEWLDRVSAGNEDVKALIRQKKFLFGGRILSNRGLQKKGVKVTYSNCYVLTPPEDNIESIFECAGKLARTFSYGGGCGIDISKLAPRGAKVNNTAKETSGAVSFMDLYSMVTGLIGQNGRRGALMLSIDCSHPDLEEFIGIKSDLDKITKANISIRISDKFMEAVKSGGEYELEFVREATNERITKTVNARKLFHKIAEMNWDYGEPGALFWDNISGYNLLSEMESFSYAGTNPCAEEPLPAGGSCLLGSINLDAFVKDKRFDYDGFIDAVRISVRALNDVLDEGMPLHPLQEQRDSVRDWRQIGLGVMGIADMLIHMNIRYGSTAAVNICEYIAKLMAKTAIHESAMLAKKHGAFQKCETDKIIKSSFYQNNVSYETNDVVKAYGLRNSQLLTIAPTGTISTMLGISGGIEPIFANYYTRKTESLHNEDVYYKVYTPIVEQYMKEHGITDDQYLPEWFVTAQTLNYHERIQMQAAWQRHIDASISSTVNVPKDFTVEDTENLYLEAWENGLKGITLFRDECKRMGVLTLCNNKEAEQEEQPVTKLQRGDIIQVNDDVIGKKRKLITGCGSLHCAAFFDPCTGDLMETYLSKGSTGGCNNYMIGLSRMVSLASRAGCDIYSIIDQLNSCGTCPSYAVRTATKKDTSKGSCCPIAFGNALLDMWKEVQYEINDDVDGKEVASKIINACPECGEELIFEGGCNTCKNCGYSKCE